MPTIKRKTSYIYALILHFHIFFLFRLNYALILRAPQVIRSMCFVCVWV